MDHSDFTAVALIKARTVFGKRKATHPELSATTLNDSLTGVTFLELEPDLAKEVGQYTR